MAIRKFLDDTGVSHFWSKNKEFVEDKVKDKVDKVEGKGLSTNDYTTEEKEKLSGIAEGAEVNQNAFGSVIVGDTTLAANNETDSITLEAGKNVTLTTDEENKKITINVSASGSGVYDPAGEEYGIVKSGGDVTIEEGIITVNEDVLKETDLVEFTKSITVSPTSAGNAIIEKIVGDSYQKQLSGKNIVNIADVSGELNNGYYKEIGTNFEPVIGEKYILSFDFECSKTGAELNIGCGTNTYQSDMNIIKTNITNGHISHTFTWNLAADKIAAGYTKMFFRAPRFLGNPVTASYSVRNIMLTLASETDQTYEPFCGNTPSPNPSFKQDIRSVGDSGYAIWEQGVIADATGVENASSVHIRSQLIPVKEGDVVRLEYPDGKVDTIGYYMHIHYYLDGKWKQLASGCRITETVLEVTVPSGVNGVKCNVGVGTTLNNVGHVCVTINGKYALIVDECNKNLFGGLEFANAMKRRVADVTMDSVNKTIKIPSKTVTGIYKGFKENTQYTFIYRGKNTDSNYPTVTNLALYYSDGSYGALVFNNTNANPTVYVSPVGKTIASIGSIAFAGFGEIYYEDFGIFEGVVSLDDFVEHQSTRHYIPLDEPLRGIGDVKDEVCYRDGLYGTFRRIKKRILCGDDLSPTTTNTAGKYRLRTEFITDAKTPKSADVISKVLCSHYIARNGNSIFSCIQGISIGTDSRIYIYDEKNNTNDITQYNWYDENKVEINYELAEPVFTPFEDQTPFYNFKAYDEVTHVSIVGLHEELNPIATMRFPRNEDGAMVTTNWCEIKLQEIKLDEHIDSVQPIEKGGTGATTAKGALENLGLTATAQELNYVDGVTSNIQTQLNNKADSSNTYSYNISRTANTVLAAPNGSAGKAEFRALVAADLPSHTHSYAGSSSAGGSATSAVKLDTATAGSATQPVYFTGGKPVATTYTLGASVPSGAKFTDTVYTHPTTSGNKHIPSGGSSGQILRWSADGTAVWGADNNTTYSAGTGISLSGTTFSNSGVRSIVAGSTNGTISVNTNGTSKNVAVAGLGSAAYTDSSAYAKADHTHSSRAFSDIKVGTTTISADSATDTLELLGNNVTITPDATNDKVTIGITKDNVTAALGYTPPTTNTTYSAATTSAAGLMSAADKTKLDGITKSMEILKGDSEIYCVKLDKIIILSFSGWTVTGLKNFVEGTILANYSVYSTGAFALAYGSSKYYNVKISVGSSGVSVYLMSSYASGSSNITSSSTTYSLTGQLIFLEK